MRKRLTRGFYIRPTLITAKDLLGKYIVRKIGNEKLIGRIIETEAYIGPRDRASHAFEGKITPRNKAEYLIGGHIYIYLVYGMYWQMNISTYLEGKPECVLIRALVPVVDGYENPNYKIQMTNKSSKSKFLINRDPVFAKYSRKFVPKFVNIRDLTNGPGKVCRWLKLDKSFYGEDLNKSKKIWLEDWNEKIKPSQILATPRIGIDYSGSYWSKIKWRFLIKNFDKL